MDYRASAQRDAIALLYAAQRHAGTFGGADLLAAAQSAWRLANENGWAIIAADSSGERIVGTATTIGECSTVDTSRRQDGLDVLVIAGMIAGPYGLMETAARSRFMGAKTVHCFYVSGWSGDIPGCDTVHRLITESIWEDESLSQPATAHETQVAASFT
ncbi:MULTISPECIES: hypothetical protein [unclassified Cryobacterium]|uniref:hypothetical protein n=1 Tax=unclassified Cryobacterium TaxID=2649013 RepID=UPI002AB35AE5|nr:MULTISPECIES: hypothetical protein [unclassified Cryobacterium]MDY7528139.1 hypothetical protein [Cryobacterium sp. 10C2]MDY7556112.1 hypothetical protein [Cryobacterium sp. 10C3]MEB0292435.1 hypothetical protein [Cryobacterium sp. 10C2]